MRYDGILLCSDYDGTLIGGETNSVSKENRDAIKIFQANGGRFTLATGRMPSYIAEVMHGTMPNAPIIALNGSVIYDYANGTELVSHPMTCSSELLYSIYSAKYCVGCTFYNDNHKAVELKKANRDGIDRIIEIANSPILKAVFIFDDTQSPIELSEIYKREFGDRYDFCRSWAYSLEVLDKSATKGNMLKRLKLMLPDITTTIGVGDYENDISLVRDADIGYAVENAIPEVKAVCDRVTSKCDQNAIAKIIYEL